jgi:hypothetical protein
VQCAHLELNSNKLTSACQCVCQGSCIAGVHPIHQHIQPVHPNLNLRIRLENKGFNSTTCSEVTEGMCVCVLILKDSQAAVTPYCIHHRQACIPTYSCLCLLAGLQIHTMSCCLLACWCMADTQNLKFQNTVHDKSQYYIWNYYT